VEGRRQFRIVQRGIEVGYLTVGTCERRVVAEPRAVVDREARARLPGVLQVPLGPPLTILRLAILVGLGVLRVDAERGVREREVRVQRVARVVAEGDVAGPVAAA